MILDKELNKQIQLRKKAVIELDSIKKQNAEIMMLAKAATESEEKKSSMLNEFKAIFEKEREKMCLNQAEIDKDK